MPQDPYVILGISRDASQAEILNAYKTKRSIYQAHVFDEGEAGADAARKLEELDQAYQIAMEASHETATVSDNESFGYSDMKTLIREKKYDEAQRRLDDMSVRDGEWHYYQAIIFYNKSWLNESKRQLEMALAEEPNNEKYKKALDNLKRKIDGTNAFDREKSGTNYYNNSAPQKSYSQNADVADGICTACQALWCADCCCECMGGDLIRCC